MPPCEFQSVPLGMQGDECLDNPTNSLFYVMERKIGTRIRCINLKNVRMVFLVDQQSQCLVWITLLESFEADSVKIGEEVRKIL